MADYRTITDAEVDPDAPLTSSLGYAWRDNPIAIAEGATGAPRIFRGAISPPVVGGTSILQGTVSASPSGAGGTNRTTSTSIAISCFIPGTVRFNISGIQIGGGMPSGAVWIQRSRRGGTYNNITQVTSNGNYAFPVIVGDRARLSVESGVGGFGDSSATMDITIGDNSVGIAVI